MQKKSEDYLEVPMRQLLGRSVFVLAILVLMLTAAAAEASAVTLVFVHGKGSSKPTIDSLKNDYWTNDMLRASSRNYATKLLIVNYDGRVNYWDAATDVSAQVNTYLNSNP